MPASDAESATTMNDKTSLAPPGAGLPPLEHLLARMGFRVLRCVLTRRRIQTWLSAETRRVCETVRELSLEQMQRQVLIPRVMGIEDSSRNWSAAMVLQHLVIVDTGIGELVTALSADHAFGREVRIADVKPVPGAGREQLSALEDALTAYLARVETIGNLHTARRHAHPWFGALDGHGWHVLAALHTMIHRRQLDAIVRMVKERP